MRLRIISGGTGATTRIENAETGERIDGVQAVEISVRHDGLVTARLQIIGVALDMQAQLTAPADAEDGGYSIGPETRIW